jgi:hypothetical protein
MEFKVTIRPLASNLDPKIATFFSRDEKFLFWERQEEARRAAQHPQDCIPISTLVRSRLGQGLGWIFRPSLAMTLLLELVIAYRC